MADAIAWFLAIQLAGWGHQRFSSQDLLTQPILLLGALCALTHALLGILLGVYRRKHRRGSLDEVMDLALTIAVTCVLWVGTLAALPLIGGERSTALVAVPLVATPVALNAMLFMRFANRRLIHHQARAHREPAVVLGAGAGGRMLVRSMMDDDAYPYFPAAILDDDPKKQGMTIEGVRVCGTQEDLAKVAAEVDATNAVIAIPSADRQTILDFREKVTEAGLHPLLLPPLGELLGRNPTAADIRDINLEDLLGRRSVTLDEAAIGETIRGKTVLVTGAGGSIGSELCRQISRFSPANIIMLDRDESALHATQLILDGNGLLQDDNLVLADIRDAGVLEQVFRSRRPDVVFHAAALKHLPLLETHPEEAWKTNVMGTLNVLRAAAAVNVSEFVNISTDKAANPTSVLGYSKRIAERLTAHYAQQTGRNYLSVRFGNVLGSRGSVIPAFTSQIQQGGPVTITHPEVKRYFMLIPEACQLVMQAATLSTPGEVMVLDMGEQIRIQDMARTLIDLSGRNDIDITFTGLRKGEKLAEELFNTIDDVRATSHPLVTSVEVPPLSAAAVSGVSLSQAGAGGLMKSWAQGDADSTVISIDNGLRITAG